MDIKIFREYRLKFYLNARHYIIVNNQQSDIHPHTWEFALTIMIRKKEFVEFNLFEKKVNEFLDRYQDKIINYVPPFDVVMPTLENMVDTLAKKFYVSIKEVGGELVRIEGSEGPSRSYILDLREENDGIDSIDALDELEDKSEVILSDIIDTILDDIIE